MVSFKDISHEFPLDNTKIDVYSKELTDLDGIEKYTRLQTLYCYDNKLTAYLTPE